jgi:hypothetical protein
MNRYYSLLFIFFCLLRAVSGVIFKDQVRKNEANFSGGLLVTSCNERLVLTISSLIPSILMKLLTTGWCR